VKGQALRKSLLEVGVELNLLDLNSVKNDPGSITCSGALEAVRAFHVDQKTTLSDPDLKLRLVGSSLGGYIVARYCTEYISMLEGVLSTERRVRGHTRAFVPSNPFLYGHLASGNLARKKITSRHSGFTSGG